MINKGLQLDELISDNGLNPNEIVLARLNVTRKSVSNNYTPPERKKEKRYFIEQFEAFKENYDVSLLDFPFCYIKDKSIIQVELNKENDIRFVYSDYTHYGQERTYLKERLNFKECEKCLYSKICDLMSKSYYLLKYVKKEELILLQME